jgi:uncharacterized protein
LIYLVVLAVLFYLAIAVLFYYFQEFFIFHPSKTRYKYNYRFPTHFKELFFDTPDSGHIHALHFFADNPKGIVYYLHGNAGSLKEWGWLYKDYTDRGYDLLLIDYRGYGKSKGKLSEKALHGDARFVYDYIKQSFSEEQIIIHGRSIGTGIAVKLASENHPKALVMESPYYNLKDVAQKAVPLVPVELLLRFKLKSNEFIKKVKCPIYIVHGTNDGVVPFKSGEKLYMAAPENASFTPIEGGLHNNLSQFDEYHLLLDKILN